MVTWRGVIRVHAGAPYFDGHVQLSLFMWSLPSSPLVAGRWRQALWPAPPASPAPTPTRRVRRLCCRALQCIYTCTNVWCMVKAVRSCGYVCGGVSGLHCGHCSLGVGWQEWVVEPFCESERWEGQCMLHHQGLLHPYRVSWAL